MKTEKQKAAEGLLYNPNRDPELLGEMLETHTRLHRYNQLSPDRVEERDQLIRSLIHLGEQGTVMSPFFCDYGYNIFIGDHFFSNTNLVILDGARVEIGRNVFIGPNVGIYTAGHSMDTAERAAGVEYAYPIKIGDDVWIGGHVCILPGVTIGSGTVIGAGSVVTKDIPSGVVAAGNPCRVLRKL